MNIDLCWGLSWGSLIKASIYQVWKRLQKKKKKITANLLLLFLQPPTQGISMSEQREAQGAKSTSSDSLGSTAAWHLRHCQQPGQDFHIDLVLLCRAKLPQLCPTLCDPVVAGQATLSMGLSKQEYWSGLPCPSPGFLPDPGIKPACIVSNLHWQTGSLPLAPPGKPLIQSCCP